MRTFPENVQIEQDVYISEDARIHPSVRGSKLKIGSKTQIYDFVVIRFVGGSGDIHIGEHCYLNAHCAIYSGNGVNLGDYVLLAPGVKIVPSNHAFESREIEIRHQGFMPSKGGVTIARDVWIGANSVILDGVSIGEGAIISAGSVVNRPVGAFEIWGGVPAKFIRRRPGSPA